MLKTQLFSLVTVVFAINFIKALPVKSKRDLNVPTSEVLKFMQEYGYLKPSADGVENMYHEDVLKEAIKEVQKYAALNQTGKLDAKTVELLNTPRCGVPDEKGMSLKAKRIRRYAYNSAMWKSNRLNYFITNWSRKLSDWEVSTYVAEAFREWSRHTKLRFYQVYNMKYAEIVVGFGRLEHGDGYPFDGPGRTLGHAFEPGDGKWSGSLHFDDDENWTTNRFLSVAIHEIGHTLGLAHSELDNAVMFAYNKGRVELHQDDIVAINNIYK